MSEAKHTLGPWIVGVSISHDYGHDWPVFRLAALGNPDPEGEEVQANAALIAVSPELLALAEKVAAFAEAECEGGFVEWNDYSTARALRHEARTAIAMARGEG